MAIIGKVNAGGATNVPIASTFYGVCNTAADQQIKSVTCPEYNLSYPITGMTLHVKFTNTNTAEGDILLQFNNAGGYCHILRRNGVEAGQTPETSWPAGAMVSLTFDGENWIIDNFKETSSSSASVVSMLDHVLYCRLDYFFVNEETSYNWASIKITPVDPDTNTKIPEADIPDYAILFFKLDGTSTLSPVKTFQYLEIDINTADGFVMTVPSTIYEEISLGSTSIIFLGYYQGRICMLGHT